MNSILGASEATTNKSAQVSHCHFIALLRGILPKFSDNGSMKDWVGTGKYFYVSPVRQQPMISGPWYVQAPRFGVKLTTLIVQEQLFIEEKAVASPLIGTRN